MAIAIDSVSYRQLHEQLVQCEADSNVMAATISRWRAAFEHISILLPDKRDPLDNSNDVLAWEMVRIARKALRAVEQQVREP